MFFEPGVGGRAKPRIWSELRTGDSGAFRKVCYATEIPYFMQRSSHSVFHVDLKDIELLSHKNAIRNDLDSE